MSSRTTSKGKGFGRPGYRPFGSMLSRTTRPWPT